MRTRFAQVANGDCFHSIGSVSVDELAAVLNQGYVVPAEAGPAWREAMRQGFDMSLVERNLGKGQWERLVQHDQALELAQTLRAGVFAAGA